jgi:acetate kinase
VERIAVRVLVFNAGSSSLKCGLLEVDAREARVLCEADAEAIGKPGRLRVRDAQGREVHAQDVDFSDANAAVRAVAALIERHAGAQPEAVGHRLVHGGPGLLRHALIGDEVLRRLRAAASFAPLHVPPALEIVAASRALYPALPQVACLDTAFHAQMPEEAQVLPLARELRAEGLRRYGFHGLSCESVLARLHPAPARLVIAHLGSGASLTALRDGRSVDTSMGLTPAGGILMSTRSGDIDPGVMVWLARAHRDTPDQLEDLVMRHSGLAGISGIGGDMRRLREAAGTGNADAGLAIRMFALSVAKTVAAQAAVLGGLDLLVFTGGIGEHDGEARAEICAHLGWMGVALHMARNAAHGQPDGVVSLAGAAPAVRVMPAEEDRMIARHVRALAGA